MGHFFGTPCIKHFCYVESKILENLWLNWQLLGYRLVDRFIDNLCCNMILCSKNVSAKHQFWRDLHASFVEKNEMTDLYARLFHGILQISEIQLCCARGIISRFVFQFYHRFVSNIIPDILIDISPQAKKLRIS